MSVWTQEIRRRLAKLKLDPTREAEIVEELAQHLQDRYEELLSGGASDDYASRAVLKDLSEHDALTRELRRVERQITLEPIVCGTNRRSNMIAGLWQDLRYGGRMLAKNPGFTLIAVITLSLGIGATTAIFTVVNTVLLRKLPYDPARLVAVESFSPQEQKSAGGSVAPADFRDWEEQSQTFEHIAAYSGGGFGLKESERVEVFPGASVTADFFATFGVQALLGRTFSSEEGTIEGPRAAILSHRLWQERFGGDPSIVGQTLKTDDRPVTIVGVMPADFKFPSFARVWTPLGRDDAQMKLRGVRYFRAIGRIKQDQTIASAQAEMQTIAGRLASAYPKENQGWSVTLSDWRDHLAKDSRSALLILLATVGLVLLIACANVANLLLARAATRRREMAIRLALGASRWALLRQSLMESLGLSALGGVLGLILAVWGIGALVRLLPELNFTFHSLSELREEIHVDRMVLLFTVAVSVLTGLLFGSAPAWQAAGIDVSDALKDGERGGEGVAQRRTRHSLVVAQIALALVLLVGAGLLLNSFMRLLKVDPGYNPRGLMTMSLSFPGQNKTVFAQQILESISATPGVESVALMSYPTLGGLNFPFNRAADPLPDGDVLGAYSPVSPAYFRTLETPLRAGREFDDRDLPNTPGVAIVNETLAREYFERGDALGKQVVISYLNRRLTREIVGVVRDIKQDEPSKPAKPEIFVPFAQLPWFGGTLLVRASNPDPLTVKNAVQQAVWSVNKELPESKGEPLEQTIAGQIAEPRLYALLLMLFATIALALAAVGIYGVMAYSVAQRTHEIGIRMALGAQPANVLTLVVAQGMRLAAIGIGIGLLASFALTRLLKTLLFGVTATDPLTFAVIALLLTGVALLACWIPARRATRVDPLVALRCE